MAENESVAYDEAVQTALQAVLLIDAAYGEVLIEFGIHEDDVTAIQNAVRGVIGDLLAAELSEDADG